jgi:stress-induced morphogen
MLDPEIVKQRLLEAFPDATVTLTDLTGTKDHYEAKVSSARFAGKSRVEQHQMVYRALGDAMQGAIHALALETTVP